MFGFATLATKLELTKQRNHDYSWKSTCIYRQIGANEPEDARLGVYIENPTATPSSAAV